MCINDILAHPVWHTERLYILPMLLFYFLQENEKVTSAEYTAFRHAILGGLKFQVVPDILAHPVWHAKRLCMLLGTHYGWA